MDVKLVDIMKIFPVQNPAHLDSLASSDGTHIANS